MKLSFWYISFYALLGIFFLPQQEGLSITTHLSQSYIQNNSYLHQSHHPNNDLPNEERDEDCEEDQLEDKTEEQGNSLLYTTSSSAPNHITSPILFICAKGLVHPFLMASPYSKAPFYILFSRLRIAC